MKKSSIDSDDEWKPGKEKEAKNKISSSDCCVIHCSDSTKTLSKLQSHDSWIALLNGAKIRNYQPILDLEPNLAKGELPDILYNRRCRNIFTLKDSLNRIQGTTKVGF